MRARVRRKTWDPVVEMAALAESEQENKELRFRALAECAKYTHPRLKAIEHSGAVDVGVSGVLRVPTPAASEEEWEQAGLIEDEKRSSQHGRNGKGETY